MRRGLDECCPARGGVDVGKRYERLDGWRIDCDRGAALQEGDCVAEDGDGIHVACDREAGESSCERGIHDGGDAVVATQFAEIGPALPGF